MVIRGTKINRVKTLWLFDILDVLGQLKGNNALAITAILIEILTDQPPSHHLAIKGEEDWTDQTMMPMQLQLQSTLMTGRAGSQEKVQASSQNKIHYRHEQGETSTSQEAPTSTHHMPLQAIAIMSQLHFPDTIEGEPSFPQGC